MRRILTVEEYREELLTLVEVEQRFEDVPLESVHGRVLASDVVSGIALPGFDNSAMDGYAVRFADVRSAPITLDVVGVIPAGSAVQPVIGSGEAVRIMTGAPLPASADTVIPVEDTDAGIRAVTVFTPPAERGAFVRRAGADIAAGTTVAPAGTEGTPYVIAAIAATGATCARVRRRPVVAVLATGDELVSDGSPLRRGQVYDSNSLILSAALARDGAEAIRAEPLRDQPAALSNWLDRAQADLVLLTGGASVGAFDVVRDVLEDAGGTFRHVRMQPGKPQGWAVWQGRPVIALPGNPLSAALSYEEFVRPLLDRILGRPPAPTFRAIVTSSWQSPPERRQLVPVRLRSHPDGRLLAEPCHAYESASFVVTSLAGADGYVIVPEPVTQVWSGDVFTLKLFASAP